MIKQPVQRIPYWAYLLIALVIMVITLNIIARHNIPLDGIGTRNENGRCTVTAVKSGSSAERAGILTGDMILALNGKPVKEFPYRMMLESYKAADVVTYSVLRNQEELQFTLTLGSFWLQYSWFYIILYLLVVVVSTTSLFILYQKPYDKTARILFIYIQFLSIVLNFRIIYLHEIYAIFASIIFIMSFNLIGIVLLHFHLLFPKPNSIFFKYEKHIKYLYLPGIAAGLILSAFYVYRMNSDPADSIQIFNVIRRISYLWVGFSLILALAMSVRQFMASRSTPAFKQMKLVVTGTLFGLATPITYSLYPEFFRDLEQAYNLIIMREVLNGTGNYIMTTFLGLAIFRHRIWNIEPYINKAIFYSLATLFIYIVYLLFFSLASSLFIEETRATHFIVLVISMGIFLFLRDEIQKIVDRFFFRETHNPASVAKEFEEYIAGVYLAGELRSKIILYLNSIFHFQSFIFLSRLDDRIYSPVIIYGIDPGRFGENITLSEEVEMMLKRSRVFSIEELKDLPGFIEAARGELVVPLNIKLHPEGFMILGSKRSGSSYTFQDVQILSLLGRRIVSLFHLAELYQKEFDRKLMLERERTRIAKDFHDDVGASLTRISILAQMIKSNGNNPETNKQWLQKISDTCREASQGITSIIWALNVKNDSTEGMVAYIRRFALEFLEETPIQCTFSIPEDLPDLGIKADIRRNLYLCVRESLNNLVKYSRASKVCISIEANNGDLKISIKDNGVGFDAKTDRFPGNGLLNMEKRMNDINGILHIESSPGNGTEIIFSVPVRIKEV